MSLAETIRELALAEGFDAVGITTADPFPEAEAVVVERVRAGYLDGLPWFTEDRARISARPQELLPWARSIICLAVSYYDASFSNAGKGAGSGPLPHGQKGVIECPSASPATPPSLAGKGAGGLGLPPSPPSLRGKGAGGLGLPAGGDPRGRVARYAWGADYHDVLKAQMSRLLERIRRAADVPVAARFFVDSGRLFERAAAQRAGLGWFGKSSNLITRHHGSWVLLAEIVTDLELPPDSPAAGHCGACDRCLVACPTGAIVAPGVVDNRRCIAYLTIEHRGSIPHELRPPIGDRIFGCDVCQEVCPHTWKLRPQALPELRPASPEASTPALLPLLGLDDAAFRLRFRGTPLTRPKRAGLLRNAAVALGNLADSAAVPALTRTLADAAPLVRGHAAWALGKIGTSQARRALEEARSREDHVAVREEIRLARDQSGG